MKRQNESIKLAALGGVGELGKNMYIIEVDEDLFVIDAGLMLPENEMLGIDTVIPDFTYLIQQKDRVQGVFLTHGHEDHIGALSYLLRQIEAPVYGTKLTIALAKAKMKEQGFKGKAKLVEIHSDTELHFDHCEISFFKTNHSIPDSVGVCIHTSQGSIVYTGDFKFDQAAGPLYKAEIGKMAKIGENGVLCLLSDSTEAEKPGYTKSEAEVLDDLVKHFYQAKGRVVVATFASELIRIQQVFDAAKQTNRKVAIVGRSLQKIYDIAIRLGFLDIYEDVMVSMNDVKNLADEEIIYLVTGTQGEPIDALHKMAKNSHRQVHIQAGDYVIFFASPLRGSEVYLSKTVDVLFRGGAHVVSGKGSFNTSSHGSKEELKFMINLMNPRYFFPVHGEYRMLKAHAKVAESTGMESDAIFIPEKGELYEIAKGTMKNVGKIPTGHVLIDGSGVGDVGNIVLRDRKLLSQDGILLVVVTLNKKQKIISAGPEIITRGFVYVRESEELLAEASKLVKEIVEAKLSKEAFDWSGIKQDMREGLNQFLFDKTKRRPMILPIIMES